jgi:hypothetical protein
LTRLRTILLFGAFAVMATVFAACGGGDSGGGSGEDPQAVLEKATFEGIESGDLDLALGVDVSGDEGGNVDVDVSGPFQKGTGKYPELDLTAKASGSVKGEDVNFDGGLVLVPNRAFVSYEGEAYEVDPTTFSFIESTLNQSNGNESPTEASKACQEAASGLKVSDFVENLTNEGGADVGGTETTKVSGELNVAGSIDQIIKLAEDPACASSLESSGPLPLSQLDEAKSEIEKSLKDAHATVYVGEDDIVRRVTAEFAVEPEGSGEKVEIEIDLTLNGVNEEQEISTPSGAKPLNDLFQKLGINPIELLQQLQGGGGLNPEALLEEGLESGG